MKLVFTLLLALSFSVQAYESFAVSGLHQHPQRQGVYYLEGPFKEQVVVDCASFLHGLTVIDQRDRRFLMLYESECYSILETVSDYSQVGEVACLEIDFSGKAWSLSKKGDDCS